MVPTPLHNMLLIFACLLAAHAAQGQQQRPSSSTPKTWQAGVLCGTSSPQESSVQSCATHNAALLRNWQGLLANSNTWPVVAKKSGSATFIILARHLKPLESNIQFAQAYCLSKGGQLAYWNTPQEYSDLAQLTLGLARNTKSLWHVFVGVVQTAGSKEPNEGWLWIHSNEKAPASFPWAKNEPNQHNSDKPGHVEDCGVLATYHGQAATKLVDDFPCNYADSNGKYMFNGWNPKLSVACRLLL